MGGRSYNNGTAVETMISIVIGFGFYCDEMSIERNITKWKSNQCERTIVNLAKNCGKILSETVFPNEVNAAEFLTS